MNFRHTFHLPCVFNCCLGQRLTEAEDSLTLGLCFQPRELHEVAGVSIIMPVNQKSRQKNLTKQLRHSFKLPHLAMACSTGPLLIRGFWQRNSSLCAISDLAVLKRPCAAKFQDLHCPLPSRAGRMSCILHEWQYFPWEMLPFPRKKKEPTCQRPLVFFQQC